MLNTGSTVRLICHKLPRSAPTSHVQGSTYFLRDSSLAFHKLNLKQSPQGFYFHSLLLCPSFYLHGHKSRQFEGKSVDWSPPPNPAPCNQALQMLAAQS